MLKATGYVVEYNFVKLIGGGRKNLAVSKAFKTFGEAERWSHENTIDGEVVMLQPKEVKDSE